MGEKKLFISYGRKPQYYVDIVKRIKKDLEERGYDLWIDTDNLRAGNNWELKLEKAIESNEEVLLFMTKHSVGRPDGFCLNEISYAYILKKPIIPVMLEEVTPPLSICRLQYLDMLKIWDNSGKINEELYEKYLHQIIEVLEDENKRYELIYKHSLIEVLEPQNFELDLAKYNKNFIGREWIYEKILNWYNNDNTSKIFWITAKPGYGKTAIAANAVHKLPNVIGIFFCQYNSVYRNNSIELIKTFAFQMASQLPEYKKIIQKIHFDKYKKYFKSPNDFFQKIILEPLNNIEPPGNNYIYIIDGLDELQKENYGIIDLIANEFEKLPKWLKVVIFSRPEPYIKIKLSKFSPNIVDTKNSSENNNKDIKKLIRKKLVSINDILVNKLIQKCQNNMLYANWLLSNLEKEEIITAEKIDNFPNELSGIYLSYFERQFPNIKKYKKNQEKIFQIMAAAKIPLTNEYLSKILDWDKKRINKIINSIGSLIYKNSNEIEFFHKTIYDWLTNEEQCINYYIDKEKGMNKIYTWISNKYNASDHKFIQNLYKNFYHNNDIEISFKIINFLIENNYAKFDDILNYISMCKGESKWKKAKKAIKKYLKINNFSDIQKAYFYYVVGRVYVNDLKNFKKTKKYLKKSILIYRKNNKNFELNIVKNTLAIYYFYKGNYKKAKNILQSIYNNITQNEQSLYSNRITEVIYSNYIICNNLINPKERIVKDISFENMEVKSYYMNNSAILEILKGNEENAKKLLNEAYNIADKYKKNYAKAAILYNKSLLFKDANLYNESKRIIKNNKYKIGQYILNNYNKEKHILNTFKIDKKNYWICFKNIDLFI